MQLNELLVELFGRVDEHVHEILDGLDGLDAAALTMVPTGTPAGANPIGWLVWHLTRVQDSHVAEILGEDQVWVSGDWAGRFGLDPDPDNTGYGHAEADVARVRPAGAGALRDYHDAVARRTRGLLERTTAEDLDRVVDERWDPPVTLGVRLVSIADDDIQHAGQAKYLRGLISGALREVPPRGA